MDEEVKNLLKGISAKLDMLNECTVKNGGGRHVTYGREDFNQMIYDKGKAKPFFDNLVKYAVLMLIILQTYGLLFK